MKSSGKRSMLRCTCWFRRFVSTPYSRAKSRSSMTCLPRMTWMRSSICSNGCKTPVSTFAMSLCFAMIYHFQFAYKVTKKISKKQLMRRDFGGKVKKLWRRGKMGREMREKLRKFGGSGEPLFRFNLNAINKEGMMRTCMTCRGMKEKVRGSAQNSRLTARAQDEIGLIEGIARV